MDLSSLYSAAGVDLDVPVSQETTERNDGPAPIDPDSLIDLAREYDISRLALAAEIGDAPLTEEELHALCGAMRAAIKRERGEVPASYSKKVRCAGCGPVWLWEGSPDEVTACPWCFNRLAGKPIPRAVRCAECGAFQRDEVGAGNGIGTCANLLSPNPPLYPDVQRTCLQWVPIAAGYAS